MGLRLRFIAVELTETEIKAVRYTRDAVPEARLVLPMAEDGDVDLALRRLRSAILQVWPEPSQTVAGIGVAVPALFDYRRGFILDAPDAWPREALSLRAFLTTAFDVPVFVGGLMELIALAEYRFGAGQGTGNLIYLHVGRQIGGGIVVDGTLFTGGNGLGGKLGHMTVEASGPPCRCGNRGCLERYASGEALLAEAAAALQAGEPSALGARPLTLPALVAAAKEGDALARRLIARAGRYLGIAAVDLIYLFNPQRFVFGGELVQAGDALLTPLREIVIERAAPLYREGVLLQRAALGEDAGLLGALAYLLTELRVKIDLV